MIDVNKELNRPIVVELSAMDVINLMALVETDLKTNAYNHPDCPPELKAQMRSVANKLRAALEIARITR